MIRGLILLGVIALGIYFLGVSGFLGQVITLLELVIDLLETVEGMNG